MNLRPLNVSSSFFTWGQVLLGYEPFGSTNNFKNYNFLLKKSWDHSSEFFFFIKWDIVVSILFHNISEMSHLPYENLHLNDMKTIILTKMESIRIVKRILDIAVFTGMNLVTLEGCLFELARLSTGAVCLVFFLKLF